MDPSTLSGLILAARTLRRVVLPAPEAPMMAVNFPAGMIPVR